jgi:nicotinamide phosphoribosyltransferase
MTFFGLQYFIKRYLNDLWNETFFDKPWGKIESFHRTFIKATLGKDPRIDHLRALHELGRIPIDIYALPEGSNVPLRVPCFVVTNTIDHAFWLPNFLETIESAAIWKACTSATTARQFRQIFTKYAIEAGEKDLSFIDWQGHDFSFRGMSGVEDVIMSGMGHLLSFSGTDSVPAILAAREYYGANLDCGGSVPATEHSVMCAGGKDNELETFRRIIEDVYPTGVTSIVSDTWDLWRVLTEYIPALKDKILSRDGKVVIRPDSGDPVNIICGDDSCCFPDAPAKLGVLRLLAEAVGVTEREGMLPLINKMGAIYGDAISLQRADKILHRIVHELKLSPFNQVFGIGSYTYEYVTRDTYGQAMKATAVRGEDGIIKPIFKKPVTDDGVKNSLHGIPAVYRTVESTEEHPVYYTVENATENQLANCAFQKVYSDGKLVINQSFEDIRKRVRA